jgi:translation elongation factor EF-1alpha
MAKKAKKIKKTVKKAKKPVKKITKKVVKKEVKKVAKKAVPKEELIGKITHYYDHIEVGIIEVTKNPIVVGEKIHVKGSTTDFEQKVDSMQIEHEQVSRAKKGDIIGLRVKDKVREGDIVFKA